MCGINGFAGFEDKQLLKSMNDAVSYRGPDDRGVFFDKDIGLGHRRLSIIDLSKKGHQPMCNEEGDVWIVYNGEIYNFMQLREDLEKKGHRFKSSTDTEVIIHSYEEYGDRCLERFNGMFAFAIYDNRMINGKRQRKIILVRDRLGIKPLHYAFLDGNLIFASEIKSILMHKGVKRNVNLNSLHKFINFNYIFGGETLLKGIYKLNPGHLMVYDIKTKKYWIKQWWDLNIGKTKKPESYYVRSLRKMLKESIKRRLIADVPLGVFLSGGIDSTSILALMSEFKDVEKPIKTFSVGFNEPGDEIEDARKTSEIFGTDHHEIFVESDALEKYPQFIWAMDTPKTNISPSYYIAQLARKDVVVCLSGLGGDELFAGYRRHKYYYHQKTFSTIIPQFIGKPIFNFLGERAKSNYLKRGLFYLRDIHDREKTYTIAVPLLVYDNERDILYGPEMKKAGKEGGLHTFKQMLSPYFKEKGIDYYDQVLKMEIKTYLNDDLLEKSDRLSMAHSIEARVPFLDHAFVEFAFSIPNKYRRFRLGTAKGKPLLIKAMKDKLPDYIVKKKKAGFNMSPYYWYKAHLKEHISSILTKKNVEKRGYFNYDYIRKILDRKPDPNLYYQYQTLWNILAFEIWHQMYVDADINRIKNPKMKISDYM